MLSVPYESSSPRSGPRVGANLDCNELLDRLPLSNEGEADRNESYLRARELAIESREADLAEWEQSLTALESDLRNREAMLEWRMEDEARRHTPRQTSGVNRTDVEPAGSTHDLKLAAQLDRKVELMNDLLTELTASQTENLAQRRELDEQSRAADRRDQELGRLESSLSDATSDVVSAHVTVTAQQDELETQREQVRSELERLQADRAAFDSDRQQVQQLLDALREEREALQRERERYLMECGPAPVTPADRTELEIPAATAEETAAAAEVRAETLSESITEELSQDSDRFNRLFGAPRETVAPPSLPATAVQPPAASEFELHDCDESSIAQYMDRLLNRARRGSSDVSTSIPVKPSRPAPPSAPPMSIPAPSQPACELATTVEEVSLELPRPRVRPRQNTEEIREGIHQLRQVANHSAQQALSRYFWKKHRSAFTLKLVLVVLSFSLAGILYLDHGVQTTSFSAMAWGAAAIGLITASNLVHTLTELNRLSARFQQESFDRPSATIS